MFSRLATTVSRRVVATPSLFSGVARPTSQTFGAVRTFADSPTAADAYKKSCYFEMDFTVADEATVFEAVQKFSAYDVGALITVDESGA
jgi:hypothetical protein